MLFRRPAAGGDPLPLLLLLLLLPRSLADLFLAEGLRVPAPELLLRLFPEGLLRGFPDELLADPADAFLCSSSSMLFHQSPSPRLLSPDPRLFPREPLLSLLNVINDDDYDGYFAPFPSSEKRISELMLYS